ncbi:MAG TPA: hypothetical protein VGH44_02950 [Candidatus Saccharimonadia bacterium]|jgi:hypothetical protein
MSSNLVLRGVVTRADKYHGTGKGFGYAFVGLTGNPEYAHVFIHVSRCRRVTGTSNEPVLTDETATATLTDQGDRTRIVMEVQMESGRPKAVRWGVIPDTDYIADFVKAGKLASYVGGHIGMHYAHPEGWINGLLEDFELEPGQLTFHVRRTDNPKKDYEPNDYVSFIGCVYDRRYSSAAGEPPNMGVIELTAGLPRVTVYLHPK